MSDVIWIKTCKNCQHDNSIGSSVCNCCANRLNYDTAYERWVCPDCSRLNMSDNMQCLCGYWRNKTTSEEILGAIIRFTVKAVGFIIILVIIYNIFK